MSAVATSVDVHQHLWPAPFVDALRARVRPPRLDGWRLMLTDDAVFDVDPFDHDVDHRGSLDSDRQLILVSLSSPLGIEDLDPDEAEPLLDAWHTGVRKLPSRFGAWASVTSREPDLAGLGALFDVGFVGLQIPATQLATPAGIERAASVLRCCESADRPVLVHPGQVVRHGGNDQSLPDWWAAVVDYPAQMQAAWWSWLAIGRSLFPDLRICFAAGAGLAPAHHERFAARGGHSLPVDPKTFVDTSSYGRQAVDSLVRVLGIDPIVLGSDRPYAEPRSFDLGAAAAHAICVTNPLRLLHGGQP
jgi:hypothetical protein